MMFADMVFDCTTGMLAFDSFNLDGILGDKFLVNGVIQPVLHVQPRRYRFRWLNTGPSRFLQLYLTDLTNPSASNPIWQISNDGNLLPKPVQVPAVALGVAERSDVIIDFAQYAGKTLYIENRLEQFNGRGPSGSVTSGGQGIPLLQIVVDQTLRRHRPERRPGDCRPFALPSVTGTPAVRAASTSIRTATASGRSTTASSTAIPCASASSRTRWSSGSSPAASTGPIYPRPLRGVPDHQRRAGPLRRVERRHNNYDRWSGQHAGTTARAAAAARSSRARTSSG